MLISDSTGNTSFALVLATEVSRSIYGNTSTEWLQFLQDHRAYIQKRSVYTVVTSEEMAYYKYRIRKYLTYKGYDPQYEKVFRIINNLFHDYDFNDTVTHVYFPDTSVIAELWRLYLTVQSQQ